MKKELLEYSFKNKLAHIPSALSMIDYLQEVFKYINQKDNIIIGKPFGAQAYYLIWKKLGWINDIEKLSMGVKHDEIDFVNYSEETIGNALGVAAGVALASKNKTYVNLSDACLQMGNTLEAIQFIGKHQLNIFVTIDYNNSQVTGSCSDIIPVEPVFDFFNKNGWDLKFVDNNDLESINKNIKMDYNSNKPTVLVIKTKKGNGFKSIENDIKKWHYKKIESQEELNMLYKEFNEKN